MKSVEIDNRVVEITPQEREALALLAEECAEVIQAVTKALRHGLEASDPLNRSNGTNSQQIQLELGDVLAAIAILADNKYITAEEVEYQANRKLETVKMWLHHAEVHSNHIAFEHGRK